MNMERIAETSLVRVARNLAKAYREGGGTVRAWRGIAAVTGIVDIHENAAKKPARELAR